MVDKVVYRLTWQDLKALERHGRSKHPDHFIYVLARTWGVPLVIIGVPFWAAYQQRDISVIWKVGPVLAILLGVWFVFVPLLGWLNKRSIRRTGIFDKDSTVGLFEDGVWIRSATGEGTTFWTAIKEIIDYAEHFFFVTAVGDTVHVIPKRAFRDRQAATEFYQEAKRLWEKHRNQTR